MRPHVRSTLSLELRDPGVDMTTGTRPARRRAEQPLTRLVTEALQGQSGVDVDGDRDYRGVPVIGAWTWLPEYGFGVVTKVDRAEAFRPLAILQTAFWSLFALLAAAAIALFVFTVLVARLRRRGAGGRTWSPSDWGGTRSTGRSARAGWAWFIGPTTRCSAVRPPSSCSAPRRPTRSPSPGSSAKSS